MSAHRYRHPSAVAVGVALMVITGSACDSVSGQPELTRIEDTATDQSANRAFKEFAGFPIPADAVVLGFSKQHGIDRYAGVIFEIPADQVDSALAAANFEGPLDVGFAPSNVVSIKGVELPTTGQVSSGQDHHRHDDGLTVIRDVGVYVVVNTATISVAVFTT